MHATSIGKFADPVSTQFTPYPKQPLPSTGILEGTCCSTPVYAFPNTFWLEGNYHAPSRDTLQTDPCTFTFLELPPAKLYLQFLLPMGVWSWRCGPLQPQYQTNPLLYLFCGPYTGITLHTSLQPSLTSPVLEPSHHFGTDVSDVRVPQRSQRCPRTFLLVSLGFSFTLRTLRLFPGGTRVRLPCHAPYHRTGVPLPHRLPAGFTVTTRHAAMLPVPYHGEGFSYLTMPQRLAHGSPFAWTLYFHWPSLCSYLTFAIHGRFGSATCQLVRLYLPLPLVPVLMPIVNRQYLRPCGSPPSHTL